MKAIYAVALSGIFPFTLNAQVDATGPVPEDGLSFAQYNREHHPGLAYSYDRTRQIHDYSDNWDLDGDGKKDKVYFIGNGGAHVYFYLAIQLSSEKKRRDYTYLSIDMPFLGSKHDLKPGQPQPVLPQFVVADFDADGRDEIYLHVHPKDVVSPLKEQRALRSGAVLLDYRNKNFRLKNYNP